MAVVTQISDVDSVMVPERRITVFRFFVLAGNHVRCVMEVEPIQIINAPVEAEVPVEAEILSFTSIKQNAYFSPLKNRTIGRKVRYGTWELCAFHTKYSINGVFL